MAQSKSKRKKVKASYKHFYITISCIILFLVLFFILSFSGFTLLQMHAVAMPSEVSFDGVSVCK